MARKQLTVREKIERSKIAVNKRYDLKLCDLYDLHNLYLNGDTYETLRDTFRYGYIQGVKAAKAEARRVSV